ncbi:hypothetical protein P7H17_24045 [Paenibacillus larvae]|nr:hypothetical protein [Paenibacillus larvae]MDT2288504.1 hypothetical protein [Paenibacillus larvae]
MKGQHYYLGNRANYCAEFPEEKTYSEEYHESLNRLTHAATEIKNLNREINELRNELEQTKKELKQRNAMAFCE